MIKTAESIERDEARLQFDAEVGERITTLRKRAGLSQKELAYQLNVTESTMSGKITAGPWYGHELEVLTDALGTTLDVLYGHVDMPPAPVSSIVGRRRRRSRLQKDDTQITNWSLAPVTDLTSRTRPTSTNLRDHFPAPVTDIHTPRKSQNLG
jgi:transcriptional regulator with XRE-family HTH domain